jgi:uncharacterized membrane protein YkvA (DUF1232 family)
MSENLFTPSEKKINEAVNRSKTRAEEYLHDSEKSRILVEEAVKKANEREPGSKISKDFWSQIKAFIRMLKAYINKEYTIIPWASIAMVTGAVLYFVSPIDLMLDWIPVAGLIDDAAVLVFVLRQIRGDLEKFQIWEETKKLPGQQVIDL